MAKLFIIIQARMTSTRLPGKVLLPLCGKTVLEVMLDRLSVFKENIIIATTHDGSEKPIVELCKKLDVNCYRGDTDNVLSRYYEAALEFGAKEGDTIVRLTSDCPLIDASILQKVIDLQKEKGFDYASASQSSGFPRGLDTEVFKYKLLKDAYENASEDYEKEHVTPYIYLTSKEKYFIGILESFRDGSKYRLTLDEEDDYKAIIEVYKKFNCQIYFSYDDLLTIMENNEYIYKLNAHVEQKKVFKV